MEKCKMAKIGVIILVLFLVTASLLCLFLVPSSAASHEVVLERPMQDWNIVIESGEKLYTFNLPPVTVYDERIPVYIDSKSSDPFLFVTYRQVTAAENTYGGLLHAEFSVVKEYFPAGIQRLVCTTFTPLLPARDGATTMPLIGIILPSGAVKLSGHFTYQALNFTETTDSFILHNNVDRASLDPIDYTPASTYSIPVKLNNDIPYVVIDSTVNFDFIENPTRFTLRFPSYETPSEQVFAKYRYSYGVYNRAIFYGEDINPLDWIVNLVDGILGTELFVIGDLTVTIGGILFTFLVIPAVVALLRLFGGG